MGRGLGGNGLYMGYGKGIGGALMSLAGPGAGKGEQVADWSNELGLLVVRRAHNQERTLVIVGLFSL